MLFVYGHPDGVALYELYVREFGRDYLAVAANIRGYSPSDAPEAVEAYAMPRLLGDVHGLLDHFGRDQCILVDNPRGAFAVGERLLARENMTRTCIDRLLLQVVGAGFGSR